jgi:hypothetical protein
VPHRLGSCIFPAAGIGRNRHPRVHSSWQPRQPPAGASLPPLPDSGCTRSSEDPGEYHCEALHPCTQDQEQQQTTLERTKEQQQTTPVLLFRQTASSPCQPQTFGKVRDSVEPFQPTIIHLLFVLPIPTTYITWCIFKIISE